MRKLHALMLATYALIAACCTTYIDVDVNATAPQEFRLDISVNFDQQSRLFLDEQMCYAWEGYEQVGVYASKYHEVTNAPYNISLDKETGLASFSVLTSTPITEGQVMAYMPYGSLNDTRHSGKVQMSIPMSQTQGVGGVFNVANMPMVSCCAVDGGVEAQQLYFRPLGAFLAVNIYSSNRSCVGEKVKYVTFDSEKTAVAGTFEVDLVAGKEDLKVEGTSKSVVVKLSEPFLVTKDNNKDNTVYVVVAPGTHSGVLSVHTNKGVYKFDYEPEELVRNSYRTVNVNVRSSKRKRSEPAPANNNIVAHRGGSKEIGTTTHPDNSLAAMRYAQSLGCMASEMDIYCTKDEKVVVYHATSNGLINGLCPWESTLEELRLAGKLANGEHVPTLEELLEVTMVPGACTKIHFDPKLLHTDTHIYRDASIRVCELACQIVSDYGAQKWVEFLMIGDETVISTVHSKIKSYGINVAWTKNSAPATLKAKGYADWISVSCTGGMNAAWGGAGSNDLQDYINAGLKVSVYCVDKVSGYKYAVYNEPYVQKYIDNIDKFYSIITNYPKWLLEIRQQKHRDYYVYGLPVGRSNTVSVADGVAMMGGTSNGVYNCQAYFRNADSPSYICINTDNIERKFPCYALAEGGRLVKVNSEGESPQAPTFDVDGMRTLTVNFNEMVYEFERISTPNALPDNYLPAYPTKEYTANGRTKTWMTKSLNWDGGKNARTLKLGTRPATGTVTGGYGIESYLSTARIAAYDDVESGGSVEGSTDDAVAGGRLYTPSEILTGAPSAGVELLHYLADWPTGYRHQSKITDAAGNTFKIGALNASSLANNLQSSTLTMQLQGICPYGWHVANAQDVYDLLCAAAAAKGESALAMESMIGIWNVADVLRSEQGWKGEVKRHASAADFGFNLYPSGVRTYAEGFSSLGESGSMFVCMLGDKYTNDGSTTGSKISGVNCCWYIEPIDAESATLQVGTNQIMGTTAMPVRCVKNY